MATHIRPYVCGERLRALASQLEREGNARLAEAARRAAALADASDREARADARPVQADA